MALKTWLTRKIEQNEQELKYLKALLIMYSIVENANVYTDSESDSDDTDSDVVLKTNDGQLLELLDEDSD